jgi:hypothetical protein
MIYTSSPMAPRRKRTARGSAKCTRELNAGSNTHGSRFDLKKYQLIHFTRVPKRYNMKQTVDLPHGIIEPETEARYLGVILDQQLRWWPHVQHVRAKAITTLGALRSPGGVHMGNGSS